jgi:addiction module HigA family antidote
MTMLNPLTRGLPPVHPGEILREDMLPATGRSKAEIARRLGVSRQTLYDLTGERQAVTAPMALRLGKLFGNGPALWIGMQSNHDLKVAENALGAELARIETLDCPLTQEPGSFRL